jgi:hypothetical protein
MSTLVSTEVYYESKAITVSWNVEGKFIHVLWKGFATSTEYLNILAKQLSFTKEKRAAKILYDLRMMGVISGENQKYTNEVYFPQMAQAGSKHAAIIIPENIFGEVSVNSILGKKNEELFDAKLFKDNKSAVDWLKKI